MVAIIVHHRSDNHLWNLDVVVDRLGSQTALRHLGDKRLQNGVVDVGNGTIADMGIDPVLQRSLPVFDCGRCDRFTFAFLQMFDPALRLLLERENIRALSLDNFVEVFDRGVCVLRRTERQDRQ